MNISEKGLELIKEFEGFRSHPYRDAVGVPTIGYGLTHYLGGRHVTMNDHSMSKETASHLLAMEVDHLYGSAVNAYVQVPMTQNQFDALCSFAYNLGTTALRKSTLLHRINEGSDQKTIANEFMKWTHAGHHVLKGLVERRMAEDALYFA